MRSFGVWRCVNLFDLLLVLLYSDPSLAFLEPRCRLPSFRHASVCLGQRKTLSCSTTICPDFGRQNDLLSGQVYQGRATFSVSVWYPLLSSCFLGFSSYLARRSEPTWRSTKRRSFAVRPVTMKQMAPSTRFQTEQTRNGLGKVLSKRLLAGRLFRFTTDVTLITLHSLIAAISRICGTGCYHDAARSAPGNESIRADQGRQNSDSTPDRQRAIQICHGQHSHAPHSSHNQACRGSER